MADPRDQAPAPPPTTHDDDRELGFGAADARPDIGDSEAGPGSLAPPSGEVAGAMNSGGQSSGEAYPAAPPIGGDHDGQSEQGYSGGDNPNATSTKGATHDRAA